MSIGQGLALFAIILVVFGQVATFPLAIPIAIVLLAIALMFCYAAAR